MSNNAFDHKTDVLIIGSGPVGLFAIFQCGMLKMKCHVVDTLEMIGGQCTALYPEKPIYDIPAWPEISGGDLIKNLEEQVAPFNPVYHLNQQVVEVKEGAEKSWIVTTSIGTKIHTKAIIIAAGVGAFGPNKPPLENLEAYEGKSVFYMVRNKESFRGKRIVIAGGGDSALDWSIALADIAEHISVIHRRPKFRGAPECVDKLHKLAETPKLDIVTPYQLQGLEGNAQTGQLDAVIVKDLDNNEKSIKADVLLPFFGLSMNLGPIATWGLNMDNSHIKVDPSTSETSTPGIFAIGDVVHYPGKLKLILTGFSESACAAHAIHPLVHPGEALHFEYSTTSGVPKIA
ncbi:MAG: NAD(P)/FAD-dependent oxidoreductase [Alphaproteobacteria bacterium]|jgi:thioredoxin reductase (NADPH)|nr:NAD(P)/FAD-dependent oxidoreductase [Alphaproteobacteria bacterium]MBT5390280.1 NAD(P)/FAD-dependent oxidoreductase [Alphaproteobacteria bacterium]MBT5540075.1 NAD(P)/FAD-dependent oxidoreductase [Alphaproteobacteria bacterium]MBT5654831.1 NAD(P)/FAD-dependent oxidoreductase [Alphaproteobacteria bacterium]